MRLVYGVGVNDANYPVNVRSVDGTYKRCPIYSKWKDMLRRCYSKSFHLKNPTYSECSVCDDWHSFMGFREWVIQQDWVGNELDKDIIEKGNLVYCPDKCAFIDKETNLFVCDRAKLRGPYPIGVTYCEETDKFKAQISIDGRTVHLGRYRHPESAHAVWLKKKRELAQLVADKQKDVRVANGLRTRY